MVNLSLEMSFGICYRSKQVKYMSRQLIRGQRPTMYFVRFDTSICAPQPKPANHWRRLQQDYLTLSNRQDDAQIIYILSLLVLFSRLSIVGQRLVVMRNKINPKLVKFKAAGDKLLGHLLLPYFSTEEEVKDWSRAFVEVKSLSTQFTFICRLKPDFEGTLSNWSYSRT